MNFNPRIAVAALSMSLAGWVGYTVVNEHYVGEAMIPTKNDVPTVGLGSTVYEDGSRVKLGDRITPVRAIVLSANHVAKDEAKFRASLPGVELHQAEYDLYLDWVYQYGTGAWAKSSMRKHLAGGGAGSHYASCKSLLAYRMAGGYDCSTPFNKRCGGVWHRQLDRFARCHAAQ